MQDLPYSLNRAAVTLIASLSVVACAPADDKMQPSDAAIVNSGTSSDQSDVASEPTKQSSSTENAAMIATWKPSGPALLSSLAGTIAIKSDCVVLIGTSGAATLPVFPENESSWDGARSILTVRGKEYRIGEKAAFSGGVVDQNELKMRNIANTVSSCGANIPVFLVF